MSCRSSLNMCAELLNVVILPFGVFSFFDKKLIRLYSWYRFAGHPKNMSLLLMWQFMSSLFLVILNCTYIMPGVFLLSGFESCLGS